MLRQINGSFWGVLVMAGVASAADAPKVTYLRDVAPILNKVGCTSGRVMEPPRARTGSSSRCAATIRSSITRRCCTICRAAASIVPTRRAASCSLSRRSRWPTAAACDSIPAPIITRPSSTGSRRVCLLAIRRQTRSAAGGSPD